MAPSPRVFLMVGLANWGKSRTLRALTSNRLACWITINGYRWFIRRVSNDDVLDEYLTFIHGLVPAAKPYALAPYCPELVGPGSGAAPILDHLRKNYQLFFWVLEHSFTDNRVVTANQIAALQGYGTVHVSQRGQQPAVRRCQEFLTFVRANL